MLELYVQCQMPGYVWPLDHWLMLGRQVFAHFKGSFFREVTRQKLLGKVVRTTRTQCIHFAAGVSFRDSCHVGPVWT